MNATKTHELVFTTDRINQGQIVTISWGQTKNGAYIERHSDASDRSIRYYWKKSGKRLTKTQLERHSLTERN